MSNSSTSDLLAQFREKEWFSYLQKCSLDEALIQSISFGDYEAAQFLIPLQTNINARDSNGDWTALLVAVNEESLEIVKSLVNAGADPNIRGVFEPDEDFPLNLAAHSKNKNIYDYLYSRTSLELRKIAEETWEKR